MEMIKKVLDTESKFLQDERKRIDKERQAIIEQKSKHYNPFGGTLNSDSFDFMNK